MKKTVKKTTAFFLAAIIAVCGLVMGKPQIVRAETYEPQEVVGEADRNVRFIWDWNDLLEDAVTAGENLNLTVAGLVLSRAVESTSVNGQKVLEAIGFKGIKNSYYKVSTSEKNDVSQPARSFGHKELVTDSGTWHVFCAVFKGTTTLNDAITDINSLDDGFRTPGENCTADLKDYIHSFDGATKENTILFITGHSLGAATANMVGELVTEPENDLVEDAHNFVYTFATPNYDTLSREEGWSNFHYFTNADDVVPTVPPGFGKIGTEHYFQYDDLSDEQKSKFNRIYGYFKGGKTFEEDTHTTGLGDKLKNHLLYTYLSFILSDLSNSEIEPYLYELKNNPLTLDGKTVKVKSKKKTVLSCEKTLDIENETGPLTYTLLTENEKVSIDEETGAITVKKGLKKGKKLKLIVQAEAPGTYEYKAGTAEAIVTLKVK